MGDLAIRPRLGSRPFDRVIAVMGFVAEEGELAARLPTAAHVLDHECDAAGGIVVGLLDHRVVRNIGIHVPAVGRALHHERVLSRRSWNPDIRDPDRRRRASEFSRRGVAGRGAAGAGGQACAPSPAQVASDACSTAAAASEISTSRPKALILEYYLATIIMQVRRPPIAYPAGAVDGSLPCKTPSRIGD